VVLRKIFKFNSSVYSMAEKEEIENSRYEEAERILKLNDSKLRKELINKRAKNLNKKKIEKLINKIESYRNFRKGSKIVYIVGIFFWVLLGRGLLAGLIGFPLLLFIFISWFINSSRTGSLIEELKKLKIV